MYQYYFSINQSTEEKVPKEIIIEDTINIKPLNPLEDIRESGISIIDK